MKYIELKNEYKQISAEIKELKSHRKLENRGNWSIYDLDELIRRRAFNARIINIAYGLLRGREYEQIERTCREDPNWTKVYAIVNTYKGASNGEENVCACA